MGLILRICGMLIETVLGVTVFLRARGYRVTLTNFVPACFALEVHHGEVVPEMIVGKGEVYAGFVRVTPVFKWPRFFAVQTRHLRRVSINRILNPLTPGKLHIRGPVGAQIAGRPGRRTFTVRDSLGSALPISI